MNIAIYGRTFAQHRFNDVLAIFDVISKHDIRCIIYEPYLKFLRKELDLKSDYDTFNSRHDLKGNADFMLSIGGDGTLLDTVSLIHDSLIPVIGINIGRLGFLSSVFVEELPHTLDCLDKHHYVLDPRSLLRLETSNNLFGENNIALNDLTIQNKQSSSMMTINAYLNGEYLNSYWADGLIISTPTGSTGYSLSCGGPIMMPQAESFILTPIAPHNLNVRPVIVSDKNIISLEIKGRSNNFLATLDSRSETIEESVQLAVRKESFPLNLIRLSNENFLTTLRKKLNWGLDKRN
ncbi:MAG: NAD kinase [Bacteroidia bacterium]|nr:NAD kinase [Bacteroidia bacterium]